MSNKFNNIVCDAWNKAMPRVLLTLLQENSTTATFTTQAANMMSSVATSEVRAIMRLYFSSDVIAVSEVAGCHKDIYVEQKQQVVEVMSC